MGDMLSVQLTGIREMALAGMEKPSLTGKDDVLIKIKSIGVCGSDVHYYTHGRIGCQVVEYPFLVGHECSGIVEECGEEVSNVKPGDLVAIDPSVRCGTCDQCLSGRPHTCRNNRSLGCPGQMPGCLTEYIVMPSFCCYSVSGLLDPEEAALIEPLSIGVYSVRLAGIKSKETRCAIFGSGPIGLSILMKLLADGITGAGVIEPLNYRLNMAKQVGAAWSVNPAESQVFQEVTAREEQLLDVVFDASGEQEAIDNALLILKPGGKLVLVGIPVVSSYRFNMDLMRRKELTIVNVRRQNHCVGEAISLVADRKIDVKQMVTHHFQLRKAPVAFDMVAGFKDGVIKAMIFM